MNNPRKSKPETNLPIPWNWCPGSWKVWKFGHRLSLPSHKHMYSEEPSLRRLNCTVVETEQRRWAPSPRCIIPFSSFIHVSFRGLGRPPLGCSRNWDSTQKKEYILYSPIHSATLAVFPWQKDSRGFPRPFAALALLTWVWFRVSFETGFDSKQTKLVSALSETTCLFWLFCFCIETTRIDVSVKAKLIETQTERNRIKLKTCLLLPNFSNLSLKCSLSYSILSCPWTCLSYSNPLALLINAEAEN
jgi:hypothetical protein